MPTRTALTAALLAAATLIASAPAGADPLLASEEEAAASAALVEEPGNRPCQLVQVRRPDGASWTQPLTRAEARERTEGQESVTSRLVPLSTAHLYDRDHTAGIIRCLTRERYRGVSAAQAIRVFTCESHLDPQATNPNGHYGVAQFSRSLFRSVRRPLSLGSADLQPGGADILNGWANTFAAIHKVSQGGWGPWSCA